MKVSIGICAYNEENNIGDLLENLVAQHLPQEFKLEEIIVVSSGSTDRTNEIVGNSAEKDHRIKLITEKERRGKTQALNLFFKVAKGDILCIVSADTRPRVDSLKKLIESMKAKEVGGACAKTIPKSSQGFLSLWYLFLWNASNKVLFEKWKNGSLDRLGGDMWAVRKGIVLRIPSEIINDDVYLGTALRRKNWQIVFAPNAEVFIASPRTVMDYFQQRERILIGHKQIRRVTGIEPSTLSAMIFSNPYSLLRMLIEEVRMYKINRWPKIFVGFYLEMITQFIVRTGLHRKGNYLKWKQIKSTKTLK